MCGAEWWYVACSNLDCGIYAKTADRPTPQEAAKLWVRDNCSLEWLNDSKLGTWCLAEQKGELVKKAKKALLEEMDIAIGQLKKEEAKEASDD